MDSSSSQASSWPQRDIPGHNGFHNGHRVDTADPIVHHHRVARTAETDSNGHVQPSRDRGVHQWKGKHLDTGIGAVRRPDPAAAHRAGPALRLERQDATEEQSRHLIFPAHASHPEDWTAADDQDGTEVEVAAEPRAWG